MGNLISLPSLTIPRRWPNNDAVVICEECHVVHVFMLRNKFLCFGFKSGLNDLYIANNKIYISIKICRNILYILMKKQVHILSHQIICNYCWPLDNESSDH